MRERGPNPIETSRMIDQLVGLKLLDDIRFRRMHHLASSISVFQSYCENIKSFRPNGNNRRIHEELEKMLDDHIKSNRGA